MIGIDIIPAQPPKGVSTIQGNFLSPAVQKEVKDFLRDSVRDRVCQQHFRGCALSSVQGETLSSDSSVVDTSGTTEGMVVDVVLSDMSEPWEQTAGFWKRSISDPYHRMMNTSGNNFRDHAGSMVCALIRA